MVPKMGQVIPGREQRTLEIIEQSNKIGDKDCRRRGTGHSGSRTRDRDGAVGGGRGRKVQKTIEKSMKTRDKWPPGEGTIHSRLRTTYRDGAVGGGRGRVGFTH